MEPEKRPFPRPGRNRRQQKPPKAFQDWRSLLWEMEHDPELLLLTRRMEQEYQDRTAGGPHTPAQGAHPPTGPDFPLAPGPYRRHTPPSPSQHYGAPPPLPGRRSATSPDGRVPTPLFFFSFFFLYIFFNK